MWLVPICLIVGFALGAVITSAAQPAPRHPHRATRKTLVSATVPATTGQGLPAVLSDGFDRLSNPGQLGSMPGGPPWQAVAGTWGISNQAAYVSAPARTGADVAVVSLTESVGAAQVTLARVSAGAGLVFDWRGPGDYWAVVAEPYYGTWNVVQVAAGVAHGLGNVGNVPTTDGTVVSATIRAHRVTLAVDGRAVRTIVSSRLVPGRGAGMTAGGAGAAQARFEDFEVAPTRPGTKPTPAHGSRATLTRPATTPARGGTTTAHLRSSATVPSVG